MYFLCVMAAGPDTFTAVNTELAGDAGFAVADADGLGRTAFDTIDTAFAEAFVKVYRMKEFLFILSPSFQLHISRFGQS